MLIQKMLDAQPTLCCTIIENRLVGANKKFKDFFEVSEAEIEKGILEVKDFIPSFKEHWLETKINNPSKPHHLKLTKDGSDFIFSSYISISHYNSEHIYILTLLDVTDLEKLKNRELAQAKMASIGELSMGLTHEINTPLTYIKGNIDLIEMDLESFDDEVTKGYLKENLQSVRDGVDRINSIIELLQDYSFSNVDSKKTSTNIYQVILDTYKLIHGRSKNITEIYLNGKILSPSSKIENELFRNLEKIKLGHVFLVLFNNSLDELSCSQMPFEARYIKIETEILENGKVKILFRDNGGGIKEGILPNIFHPFVSGKTQSGMGLGLNIAKKIIDTCGGEITAENFEGDALFKVLF
ncbi:histidine kinase [Thiovulum sp. ES]|nr:histidine kinase [Thiovulum sp. ES]